jgi:hypothetical protein
MPEPRLAIARLSRFTVNGVAASDFEDVLNSLESWDDWCRAWSQRASIHESNTDDPFKLAMRQIAGAFAQLEKARLVGKLRAARERSGPRVPRSRGARTMQNFPQQPSPSPSACIAIP